MHSEITGRQLIIIISKLQKLIESADAGGNLELNAKFTDDFITIVRRLDLIKAASNKYPDSTFNINELTLVFLLLFRAYKYEDPQISNLYKQMLKVLIDGHESARIFAAIIESIEFADLVSDEVKMDLLHIVKCIKEDDLTQNKPAALIVCEEYISKIALEPVVAADLDAIFAMLQDHDSLHNIANIANRVISRLRVEMQRPTVNPQAAKKYFEILMALSHGPLAAHDAIDSLKATVEKNIATCLRYAVRYSNLSVLEEHVLSNTALLPYLSNEELDVIVLIPSKYMMTDQDPLREFATLQMYIADGAIARSVASRDRFFKYQKNQFDHLANIWAVSQSPSNDHSIFALCECILEKPMREMRMDLQVFHMAFLLDYLCSSSARAKKYLQHYSNAELLDFMTQALIFIKRWQDCLNSKTKKVPFLTPHKAYMELATSVLDIIDTNINITQKHFKYKTLALILAIIEARSLFPQINASIRARSDKIIVHYKRVDSLIVQLLAMIMRHHGSLDDLSDILPLIIKLPASQELVSEVFGVTEIDCSREHLEQAYVAENWGVLLFFVKVYSRKNPTVFNAYIDRADKDGKLYAFWKYCFNSNPEKESEGLNFPETAIEHMLTHEIQSRTVDPDKIKTLMGALIGGKKWKGRSSELISTYSGIATVAKKKYEFYIACKEFAPFPIEFLEELLYEQVTARAPKSQAVNAIIASLQATPGWAGPEKHTLLIKGIVLWATPYFLSEDNNSPRTPLAQLVVGDSVMSLSSMPRPLKRITEVRKILNLSMLDFIKVLLKTGSWETVLFYVLSKYPSSEYLQMSPNTNCVWHDLALTPEACTKMMLDYTSNSEDCRRTFSDCNNANYTKMLSPLEIAFKHNNMQFVIMAVQMVLCTQETNEKLQDQLFEAAFKYVPNINDEDILLPLLLFLRGKQDNEFAKAYLQTITNLLYRRRAASVSLPQQRSHAVRDLRRQASCPDMLISFRDSLDRTFENARSAINYKNLFYPPRSLA